MEVGGGQRFCILRQNRQVTSLSPLALTGVPPGLFEEQARQKYLRHAKNILNVTCALQVVHFAFLL